MKVNASEEYDVSNHQYYMSFKMRSFPALRLITTFSISERSVSLRWLQ